ncbi:MAG: elongation factor P [Candidatus Xiphinematobacter sp.]|nr:MAG: elongation factor P [Candidatus Xiphinematobacter sp.]QQY10537.1 MAG: elongation factor P [Candidatus Xiphinematobacter sp.]QQY11274.1 MAG: elongation factor P [Candidatus Xiphinematobacter sp.]
MALANDLRKGMAVRYNKHPAIVLEVQHRTPGNLRAFVQVLIRYISTGRSAEVRFSSTEKVELVEITRQTLEFSYADRHGYHFMEPKTYETISLQEDLVVSIKEYLTENLLVTILKIGDRPVQIELPSSVSLKVIESPEGVRGDSVSNVLKPVTLETGKVVHVPLFIREGQAVKVDTRTGAYLGRSSS